MHFLFVKDYKKKFYGDLKQYNTTIRKSKNFDLYIPFEHIFTPKRWG